MKNMLNEKQEISRRLKTVTLLSALAVLFCFLSPAYANNLVIKNVRISNVASGSATIQFDISQDNSWRFSPQLHDAAWVFVKYSVDGGDWKHANLSTTALPSVDFGSIAAGSTALTATVPSDNAGAFLFRGAEGNGNLSTSGVKFNITGDSLDPSKNIAVKVFGLEMVYIPQGAFYLGPQGTFGNAFYKYNAADPTVKTNPYLVTSEGAINVGTEEGKLYYSLGINDSHAQIPDAYPKGYQAFYIMKYELTQGQYRDFLNTLTRTQQAGRLRYYSSYPTWAYTVSVGTTTLNERYVLSRTTTSKYRNGIRCRATFDANKPLTFYCDLNGNDSPNETNDGEYIACGFLKMRDLFAYADWAGLRPMTEFEFVKAARGTAYPVPDEYVWGTTNYTDAIGITSPGAINERATNSGHLNSYFSGQVGPMRSGFAATNNSSRQQSGSSFYGAMELGGNLRGMIAIASGAAGRALSGNYHGNGILNSDGETDISNWNSLYPVGITSIGGGFFDGREAAYISSRSGINNGVFTAGYNGGDPTSVLNYPGSSIGIRCVRTSS